MTSPRYGSFRFPGLAPWPTGGWFRIGKGALALESSRACAVHCERPHLSPSLPHTSGHSLPDLHSNLNS